MLLTLISIIQALALELLWSKIQDSPYLWPIDGQALLAWSTLAATFFGILLIWLVFTTMVMCLVWDPLLRDSIAPFIIGLQEFLLVSLIGETFNPYWLFVLASIFISTNWIIHVSMRRARAVPDNDMFFRGLERATYRDFLPLVALVIGFTGVGFWLLLHPEQHWLSYLAVAAAIGIMIAQLLGTRRLWQRAMNMPEEQLPANE